MPPRPSTRGPQGGARSGGGRDTASALDAGPHGGARSGGGRDTASALDAGATPPHIVIDSWGREGEKTSPVLWSMADLTSLFRREGRDILSSGG